MQTLDDCLPKTIFFENENIPERIDEELFQISTSSRTKNDDFEFDAFQMDEESIRSMRKYSTISIEEPLVMGDFKVI
jgi:hypothetical protein